MLKGFFNSKNLSCSRLSIGIATLGLILVLNLLFSHSTWAYKHLYLNGLFQIIRIFHDFTLGWLPIPSIYIIPPLFFFFFLYKKIGSLKSGLIALLAAIIWIINLFYLLWGFNYSQPSIYDLMSLKPQTLDATYIAEEFQKQTEIVEKLSRNEMKDLPLEILEDTIRFIQEEIVSEIGLPVPGRVRIRKLPGGSLLRIRTSGIYIPHAMEGHIDGGLYYKQHPFTLAHEMAHGYGLTDESVCNFIAYLTCQKSTIRIIRYSGELAYWRYLARAYKQYYPKEWTAGYAELEPRLLEDLQAIREHIGRYKDLMPVMRDVIYDNYLKTHGVAAGIASYDQMVDLIAAYNRRSIHN